MLSFAMAESVEQMEANIDRLNIDPTNPLFIKELTKAMVRIDKVSQVNMGGIYELSNLSNELAQEVKKLKQEVEKLKRQLNHAKK
ncbi:hypothetical protein E5K63_07210 [Helicobacter pylori]|uniref:hypothetical protein n=2 Tax=Helicobacter pylori TaxID=210 RepID=UPI000D3C4DC8|nr:hypothetical protein [Helicobacter pylori]MCQ2680146.1 hypothetical protein [Helicobacter pylori]MCQ2684363.1 hypothetical protein [Helicobacter pylori]MCQ2869644.1 hypothetical protein [Helicobacter pylori]PUB96748.1 hypothetical protein C2S43_05050 [Helicobacter pylori]PUD18778.1 hypothetical protein C2S45_03580 [Helicobacter pylori]